MNMKTIWEKDPVLNKRILQIKVKSYLLFIDTLICITVVLSLWKGLLNAGRTVFGAVYTLILPGFLLSHVILKDKKVDILERIALSFALSITVVPLILFYLNLIEIKINTFTTFTSLLGICLISAAWIYIRDKKKYNTETRKKEKKRK